MADTHIQRKTQQIVNFLSIYAIKKFSSVSFACASLAFKSIKRKKTPNSCLLPICLSYELFSVLKIFSMLSMLSADDDAHVEAQQFNEILLFFFQQVV